MPGGRVTRSEVGAVTGPHRKRRYWLTLAVLSAVVVSWLITSGDAMQNKQEVMADVLIDMPKNQAWTKLRDLSLAHNYVPGLVKTELTTEQTEGVGASRKVYQSETKGIDETVVEWEDGHGFLIRLHRGEDGPPPPFREAWFRYRLDDAGSGKTRLTTRLIYTVRWGGLGAWLERNLLRNAFRGVVRDVAVSLKLFYESGEKTTPERLKQAKQTAAAAAG